MRGRGGKKKRWDQRKTDSRVNEAREGVVEVK